MRKGETRFRWYRTPRRARILIDQFFWKQTNQRSDRYGGKDFEGRTRFASEVIASVRNAVGPDFPIVLRFSQWKTAFYTAKLAETPEELAAFLEPLTAAGVDAYHCSTRRFWEPEFEGSDLNLAGWVRLLPENQRSLSDQ